MTAIVGPNGCGKSNVSDAIRWVIGEQSPKAMRSSKMTDVIFNGTDKRKPLGMAEVSVTFADCDGILDIAYDEVTITRRVFQSGEGQYFMNKTPCRLKDIQRLFMDTGVGSASYSFMQQGRIDQILSARPEDRRAVFEEASGITKFKSDKQEAIRKLEHTEANLLRLADVIREVKRQIGSLQRQAGKARRYKDFSGELRQLDIYATRERLKTVDADIAALKNQLAQTEKAGAGYRQDVEALEQGTVALRASVDQTQQEIGATLEQAVQGQSRLDHTHDLIKVNSRQIEEYTVLSQRDAREVEAATAQIDSQTRMVADLAEQQVKAATDKDTSEQELKRWTEIFTAHQEQIGGSRTNIQKLREESLEAENRASHLQNKLVEIDSRERSAVLRRERLAAEKSQLERVAKGFADRQTEMGSVLSGLQGHVTETVDGLNTCMQERTATVERITQLQQEVAKRQSDVAAWRMKLDMLREQDAEHEEMPAGTRKLIDPTNPLELDPDAVLGTLASVIDVDAGYEIATEAAVRSWLDAVIVRDEAQVLHVLQKLSGDTGGAARLLLAGIAAEPSSPPSATDLLSSHIHCDASLAGMLRALVGHIVVVPALDARDPGLAPGGGRVTLDGQIDHGRGRYEYWMRDSQASTSLARKQLIGEAEQSVAALGQQLTDREAGLQGQRTARLAMDEQVSDMRKALDERKRALAQREGEMQVVTREANEARERHETVSWELDALIEQDESGSSEKEDVATQITQVREQRTRLASDIAEQSRELQKVENQHNELQVNLTEHRIRHSETSHRASNLAQQYEAAGRRLGELKAVVDGRSEGIRSYQESIKSLTAEVAESRSQIGALEQSVGELNQKADGLKQHRAKQQAELGRMEETLAGKRRDLETARSRASEMEVRLAETQVQRQNQLERATGDYRITLDQLLEEPEPDWHGEPPSLDDIETKIAELRTKIEAMGPVNLVAIDEYKEHEERYAFLTSQEHDLVTSKQQLMEMIRKINQTTTEMFSQTFERVNENFQNMFQTLFGGGSAKLVLVNEEDILECGIEIIARPPGKRLQNVSLLSGGERTMTAVALLFSVYMIKPSPFCMLDELDAALDDSNIGRFVKILEGFLEQSQFVVITHSRQTISAAHVIYGVTMPERGVSRIVSMKFAHHEKQLIPEDPAEASVGKVLVE